MISQLSKPAIVPTPDAKPNQDSSSRRKNHFDGLHLLTYGEPSVRTNPKWHSLLGVASHNTVECHFGLVSRLIHYYSMDIDPGGWLPVSRLAAICDVTSTTTSTASDGHCQHGASHTTLESSVDARIGTGDQGQSYRRCGQSQQESTNDRLDAQEESTNGSRRQAQDSDLSGRFGAQQESHHNCTRQASQKEQELKPSQQESSITIT